jgi:putative transposase
MILLIKVEKHLIKKNNPFFNLIDNFCFNSKNLYNAANYIVRQVFINDGKWVRYQALDKALKQDMEHGDYRNMPSAQAAQQTLRLLDKNWTSFFKAIKAYKRNPESFSGRPKLPKYKEKTGRNILILTNQVCKLKDGIIHFPKTFNGFTLETKVSNLNQVRFLPRGHSISVEIVYEVEDVPLVADNERYYSIDIGLDNLLTVVNNFGEQPFVIDGKGLKSMNQYYNKKRAFLASIAKKINGKNTTKQIKSFTSKRNRRVEDYMHKASRLLINQAVKDNVSKIIVGLNKDFKREINIGKVNNQKFVMIPFDSLIRKIQYKAAEVGIEVILTEESYTSGTSFLDGELPIRENYNKKRRKHRGLFVSNSGIKINADVNGAYQILKKVFPNAFGNGIEGVRLHPVVLTV